MTTPAERGKGRGHRWPPALAVLVLCTLPLVLPEHLTLGPGWILPAVGGLFFAVIVVADPSAGGRVESVTRPLTIVVTFVLIVGGAWMMIRLADDLITGDPSTTGSAAALLSSGALVWVNNSILFGLLYWELDEGGPRVVRATRHQIGVSPFPSS